jgi:beta-mannanase
MMTNKRILIIFAALVTLSSTVRASQVPAIGTAAEAIQQFDATSRDMGLSLKWNQSYMKDDQSINQSMFDALTSSSRNVTHIIVTFQIQSSLSGVIHGDRDANLVRVAKELAAWQHDHPGVTVIVRPFHEMNGDWYPWGFGNNHNGNTPAQLVPAWKHVRSVMRHEFPSLAFMWCPNVLLGKEKDFASYFPGEDQVEYLGLDGYNHSTSVGGWKSLQEIFDDSLVAIRKVDKHTPLVIAETATTEPNAQAAAQGHTKAEWFGNLGWWMHNEAPKFNIVTIIYFNYPDIYLGKPVPPEKYKNDYLIYDPSLPSAAESRDVFRKRVSDLH